jgi:hypothetical protein
LLGISFGKQICPVFSLQNEPDGRFEPVEAVVLKRLQFAPNLALPVDQSVFLGNILWFFDLLREPHVEEEVDLLLAGREVCFELGDGCLLCLGGRFAVFFKLGDPMVRSFWENEFAAYGKQFLHEAIAPIQNKVGQLLMSPHSRNILGQVRSRIDARFMMDNGRIFIANLSKGKLGADKANLLGALLVTQFRLAAMSRADTPEDERKDFFLYVDEFQSFASDSFASILSEARKYRLCLTLAHQYLDQVRPSIGQAVFGNVGSLIAFRVGHADARVLEKAFGDAFPASQLTSLNNHEVHAKLLSTGQDGQPFLGRTLPPFGAQHGRRDTIIRRSREKYAVSRLTIERKIKSWLKQAR